jgi:phosphate transport system substrate-binding protein
MIKLLKRYVPVFVSAGITVAILVSVTRPSSPAPAPSPARALIMAPAPPSPPNILLNAAGATFPYPIYSKWFDAYHKLHPDVEINYQSIGSGGGIQQLKAGTVDFGASDMPLNDKLLATFSFKIIQFPTVLGAVMPTYNIPGVHATLNFTPQALAGIYLGQITKWNDPAITKANPGVSLPGNNIVVVHRSDGSGTTFVWTDYLSKVSSEWKSRVGSNTSVNWPVGLGGKGNEGVSGLVKQTPNSIGYVELIYALQTHLPYGSVQNSAGHFIKASLTTVTAAAAGAAAKMQRDVRVSITNAPGANAYPICSFTYLLIPAHIADATKRQIIKGFLHWMLTDGQKYAEPLAYASLPEAVVAVEMKHIVEIN